jgi:hypothetical protein
VLYNILFLILVFYFVFFISLPLLSLRAVIFCLVCLAFSCPRKNFVFFHLLLPILFLTFEDTMNLNLYEDHFSYGSDMEKYSHSYPCLKCDRLWKHVGTLYRHERTCTGSVTSFIDVQDIA